MNLLTHLAHVTMTDRPDRSVAFRATCVCGWHGPARDSDRKAWGDVDQHESNHPMGGGAAPG